MKQNRHDAFAMHIVDWLVQDLQPLPPPSLNPSCTLPAPKDLQTNQQQDMLVMCSVVDFGPGWFRTTK